ncbi:TAXI family TRAP transporter solute-binding subunit [Desulfonatronum thioautotrophicum]|uniref:TAXI family TRAP transporter solute-binding subunit n=1 Tax=Desulfonatronum thioautotrophicum TaxID=617001 RepID=UPI001FC99AD1|nr:TAXI family TRAP transporter solute-binding subunit [Desulfonatronum thioautotrophicum]
MMKSKLKIVLIGLALLALCIGTSPASAQRSTFLAFGGGPTGGTFNYFANGIAIYLSRALPNVEISSEGSGGSGENLRRLHAGQIDFGIVYSGDAYLGRAGQLPNDDRQYTNVRTMGYLYGAPAQLVVRADAGITSARDLAGRRVAVGNAGSGAALAAERFFRHMELWDEIRPQFLGYSPAASAFRDGQIDAFWVLVGYPNASIIEAATQTNIALVNLHYDAEESGFYDAFPFYARVEIPADTYRGQSEPVTTFQDSTFWMTHANLSDDIVYESLKIIYSPEGLRHMVTAHAAAREMSIESGLTGASVPLHPGAYKFWTEQGLTIPDELKP